MNNFFGYKNNADDFYGENYLDRKLSEETTQLIEDKQEEVKELLEVLKNTLD